MPRQRNILACVGLGIGLFLAFGIVGGFAVGVVSVWRHSPEGAIFIVTGVVGFVVLCLTQAPGTWVSRKQRREAERQNEWIAERNRRRSSSIVVNRIKEWTRKHPSPPEAL